MIIMGGWRVVRAPEDDEDGGGSSSQSLVVEGGWQGRAGSQGRRARLGRVLGVCLSVSRGWAKWIGANEAANGTGGSGSCVGPLETLEEGCNIVWSLCRSPPSDLRLEITRKGPLRCVGCLPPAFENVSPNLRWKQSKQSKPSKPSKHSRASTQRHKDAFALLMLVLLLAAGW